MAFFSALFAARTDVYAVRYDNQRTGKSGWVPAVRGGWQKGVRHEDRKYLPLTSAVLAAHLLGEVHIGVGADNLCHQAIFMNHASGAVASPEAKVVQVGDAIWQRAQRRGLVQGAVRPVGVVEVLVLAQHSHQVPLVPDQRAVR